MKAELVEAISEFFDNLEQNEGGECADWHDFKGSIVEIIEKTFEA